MDEVLITGGAGFIGYHLQKNLVENYKIHAIDLLSSDNKVGLQRANLLQHISKGNILENFLEGAKAIPKVLVHLAAETGISGSLNNPQKYFKTNVEGTFNVLEQCRKKRVQYLIYASSSSVYEPNQAVMPENAATNRQLSFYGTTKKMKEVMVENYCKQFGITAIGLRFFTVYGSYTRTDMAAYKFMKSIQNGEKITLYNQGDVYRDFTHVSDVVHTIQLLIEKIQSEPRGSHQIFNVGQGNPIAVKKYADLIAENLGLPLMVQSAPLPSNELSSTNADASKLFEYTGFKPKCTVEQGIKEMTDWFKKEDYK
jgi:UDP-glucuronate 4-epimerase